MHSLYKFFSSIRLTLILTYIVVAVTMAGSFVLLFKKESFDTIDKALLIDWIRTSSFSSYWWIAFLIALIFMFSMNTLLCTFDRLSLLIRAWRGKRVKSSEEEETSISEDIRRGKGLRMRTLLPYIAHIGFFGSFDYGFHDAISGGIASGFNGHGWRYYQYFTIPFAVRAAFHPFNLKVIADKIKIRNKMDVYVGLATGWSSPAGALNRF